MCIPKDQSMNEDSVTVIVSRRVKVGREEDFEDWVSGISNAAWEFEGYLGTKIIRPSTHTNLDYVVIIKFNHYKNLKNWEDSAIRATWIEKTIDFTEGVVKVQKLTGLEFWFTLPKTPLKTPPPRYKMVIVTFLALFPTINFVNLILNPLLYNFQGILLMLINVMVTVIFMTYGIMPLMTRLFAFWLFKAAK
ncbi:MAG: antibiotic biosynthesis monooxygenase [Spirochaetia bacterium]|jgi:antibiotic biosynthesis monooxygenase (ABM) superfamily enzyme|nr:antibiotic biosynthesis monooxygenase [Spirochaetia bacterium]